MPADFVHTLQGYFTGIFEKILKDMGKSVTWSYYEIMIKLQWNVYCKYIVRDILMTRRYHQVISVYFKKYYFQTRHKNRLDTHMNAIDLQ